jgi:hypothetical protein
MQRLRRHQNICFSSPYVKTLLRFTFRSETRIFDESDKPK